MFNFVLLFVIFPLLVGIAAHFLIEENPINWFKLRIFFIVEVIIVFVIVSPMLGRINAFGIASLAFIHNCTLYGMLKLIQK